MMKKRINVYTNLNNIEENSELFAIIHDDVIKYIDLDNNKMIIDMQKNVIIRENSDYIFNMDFVHENITIKIKKMDKYFEKRIKTLLLEKTKKRYLIRYLLEDENIVNEYYIDF